jgi:hypothetical protein
MLLHEPHLRATDSCHRSKYQSQDYLRERRFSNSRLKIDTCMDYTRPSLALGIESIRKSFLDAKGRDVKLRYITEITTENILYCKELMKIADVRHLDGIKGNFMVRGNTLHQQSRTIPPI